MESSFKTGFELVLIVGFPRSGTTMLRGFLSEASNLCVHEIEPHWILDFWLNHGDESISKGVFIPFLVEHRKFPANGRFQKYYDLTRKDLERIFSEKEAFNLKEIVCKIFADQFKSKTSLSKKLLLKYPAFISYSDLVYFLDENAQVLNIYRDPRAAINSYLSRWKNKSIRWLSEYWNRCIDAGFNSFKPDNTLNIKYEDLIFDGKKTLESIFDFLGETQLIEVSEFERSINQWSMKQVKESRIRGFKKERTIKWKEGLDKNQVKLIQHYCHNNMEEIGYDFDHDTRVTYHQYFGYKTYDSLIYYRTLFTSGLKKFLD